MYQAHSAESFDFCPNTSSMSCNCKYIDSTQKEGVSSGNTNHQQIIGAYAIARWIGAWQVVTGGHKIEITNATTKSAQDRTDAKYAGFSA